MNRIYVAYSGWKRTRAVDRCVQTPEPVGPRDGLLLEGELQVHLHEWSEPCYSPLSVKCGRSKDKTNGGE